MSFWFYYTADTYYQQQFKCSFLNAGHFVILLGKTLLQSVFHMSYQQKSLEYYPFVVAAFSMQVAYEQEGRSPRAPLALSCCGVHGWMLCLWSFLPTFSSDPACPMPQDQKQNSTKRSSGYLYKVWWEEEVVENTTALLHHWPQAAIPGSCARTEDAWWDSQTFWLPLLPIVSSKQFDTLPFSIPVSLCRHMGNTNSYSSDKRAKPAKLVVP